MSHYKLLINTGLLTAFLLFLLTGAAMWVKGLLKGHPKLWAFPENNLGNVQNLCIEPLYELSLPYPFNSATRFYSELLQAESLRYINNLAVGVNNCSADIDIRYLVNTALKDLKYIAKNASTELIKRSFTDVPDYKPESNLSIDKTVDRNSHHTLYLLKLYSVKLFFEVQELYDIHTKNTETFEEFFINTLNENVSGVSFLKCSSFYFVNKINRFLFFSCIGAISIKWLSLVFLCQQLFHSLRIMYRSISNCVFLN